MSIRIKSYQSKGTSDSQNSSAMSQSCISKSRVNQPLGIQAKLKLISWNKRMNSHSKCLISDKTAYPLQTYNFSYFDANVDLPQVRKLKSKSVKSNSQIRSQIQKKIKKKLEVQDAPSPTINLDESFDFKCELKKTELYKVNTNSRLYRSKRQNNNFECKKYQTLMKTNDSILSTECEPDKKPNYEKSTMSFLQNKRTLTKHRKIFNYDSALKSRSQTEDNITVPQSKDNFIIEAWDGDFPMDQSLKIHHHTIN